MEKTLALLFCIIFYTFNAQTQRFIYELTINKSENENFKHNMVLDIDINNNEVKFYDHNFLVIDSLRQKNKNLMHISETNQVIKRTVSSSENYLYRNHLYDYFEIKSNDKIVWEIQEKTKTINNILLNQAITNFGGRDWVAWFSTEIPINEGPYKFNGLPGLILEIYDTNDTFHYSMIKNYSIKDNSSTSNFVEKHYGKTPISVSLNEFQKIKLNYYHNIMKILNDFSKKGGSIAYDEYALRERNLQKSIRNHYFPIELDTAIQYPKK